jgi:hypothetical protein
MRFTDGVSVETGGPLRSLRLSDGWYVVGEGMLIPVRDAADARATVERMRGPVRTYENTGRRPRIHPDVAAALAASTVQEAERTGLPLADVLAEREGR